MCIRDRLETRINIIGYIARGGQPSARDNLIASQLGCAAADAALDIEANEPVMVGIQSNQTVTVPMQQVIERSPKLVGKESELWGMAESLLVSQDQEF